MAKAQLIRVVLFLKQDQQGTPENTLFFFFGKARQPVQDFFCLPQHGLGLV